MSAGCYLDCFDYPACPCGVADYASEATGPLAGTGAGRTARKADTGPGFHPATRPTSLAARVQAARPWLAAREKWVALLDCASPNSTVGKICRDNIAWIDLSLRRLDGR